MDEEDEILHVDLSAPTNGSRIGDGRGVVTIIDNDPLPSLAVSDLAHAEGDSGQSNADVAVSLSAPSSKTVAVSFATSDGTAMEPMDYAEASGTLTFSPGQVSKAVSVKIYGDNTDEIDETLSVDLSDPLNSTISDGHGVLTLINDEVPLVTAAPSSLVFGSPAGILPGAVSTPQAITYTNVGDGSLAIRGFTLVGANPADFFSSTDTCHAPLPPGASCSLEVRFAPQAEGSRSAVIVALTNAPSDPATTLTGLAKLAPEDSAACALARRKLDKASKKLKKLRQREAPKRVIAKAKERVRKARSGVQVACGAKRGAS